METIKNYLDSMFSSLPDTPEVRKAREELYQMMEDKYYELKEEGKSEHEAVGTVITEFGSLEEIKEELGITGSHSAEDSYTEQEPEQYISLQQAREYLAHVKKYSTYIAIGVMFCIFSPIFLIFMGGLSDLSRISENVAGFGGLFVLFIFVIIAVAIFIYCGNQLEEYNRLKETEFHLEKSAEAYLKEERKSHRPEFSIKIVIGVVLCIFSVMPLLFSAFFLGDVACVMSVCILLVMVGIGVFFFVSACMVEESYKILLQEGEFKRTAKNKNTKILDTIGSVYWCLVTAVYLGWSFLTFRWGFTWIIWPVAGVLYGAIAAIVNAACKE